MPSITLNIVEFLFLAITLITTGCISWDILWTAILSDPRATAHFATASRKRRLMWIGLIIWAVYTVIISVKAFF